jgi:hypothetical protein
LTTSIILRLARLPAFKRLGKKAESVYAWMKHPRFA